MLHNSRILCRASEHNSVVEKFLYSTQDFVAAVFSQDSSFFSDTVLLIEILPLDLLRYTQFSYIIVYIDLVNTIVTVSQCDS